MPQRNEILVRIVAIRWRACRCSPRRYAMATVMPFRAEKL
jgi:hypothetical protein